MLVVNPLNASEVEAAGNSAADAVILDLEVVEPAAHEAARKAAREALTALRHEHQQRWVRVHASHELLAKPDIRAVVGEDLTGIVLPRATSQNHIRYIEALLRDAETAAGVKSGATKLIAAIESAAGLLAALEIARASGRVVALQFNAEAYRGDLGVPPTRDRHDLQFPRGQIGVAARASGVLAVDTPFDDALDEAGLRADAETALVSGFHGKVVVSAEQVGAVNAIFRPTPEAVEYARRVVAAHEELEAGAQLAVLDGRTIGRMDAARAKRIVELATAIDAREAQSTI